MNSNMQKVIFKFDKEKDLWNQWHKANWKSPWSKSNIDPNIKKICENKKFKESKKELEKYFSKLYKSEMMNQTIICVENSWKKIEKEFFKRMDKIIKRKYSKKITAYLTSSGTCSYDPNEPSFMFSIYYSIPKNLSTCGHEIMHLYFHEFYWNSIEKEIGKEKTSDLKEALTVILNLEFIDLWFNSDSGYETHKELRDFITKTWRERKDFEFLLKKCVDYLKEK
ncbi:MAG: hypothetical protein AABY06_00410 [Nanoarchaeota archaeon]